MIKDKKANTKNSKPKIEHLIRYINSNSEYNAFFLHLISNFPSFIKNNMMTSNLGIENSLCQARFEYITLKNTDPRKYKQLINSLNTNLKDTILKNISILWDYINKISKNKNPNFYQCLSCIYGAFYGDCFNNFELSHYSKMTMSLIFAIMDNVDIENIDPYHIDYYYLSWFLSTYDKYHKIISLKNDFIYFVNNFPWQSLISAHCKYFKNHPYYENNDYFIFNGFLMRISPFIVWFYIFNEKEIKQAFISSSENLENLLSLFDKIEKEVFTIISVIDENRESSLIIACFCILAFGAICQLKANKIIQCIRNITNNYKNNDGEFKNVCWGKVKTIIDKEIYKYRKDNGTKKISDYFFIKQKKTSKELNYHDYKIPFRLTLYYLYHINNYTKENNEIDFDKIIDEIYSLNDNSRENAAIVGTVIGPMVGYKNFSNKFENIFKKLSKDKYYLSPSLIVIYVYYLFGYKRKDVIKFNDFILYFDYEKKSKYYYIRSYNTFRMILNFFYNDLKLIKPDIFETKKNEKIENDILNSNFHDNFSNSSENNKISIHKAASLFICVSENEHLQYIGTNPKTSLNESKKEKNQNNNISEFSLKETKETVSMGNCNKHLQKSSSCIIF